jgi:hypothetical protein
MLARRLSSGAYYLLVRLYPASFRRAFGPQLQQSFDDLLAEAATKGGLLALLPFWQAILADLVPSLWREHLAQSQEEKRMTIRGRALRTAYFWFYAAFTLVLVAATALDLTHAGDVLNVGVGLGATFGVYAYLHARASGATAFWRSLLVAIVAYDAVSLFLIVSTASAPAGFHWLLGSTALGSKAYDLLAILISLPALRVLGQLGQIPWIGPRLTVT